MHNASAYFTEAWRAVATAKIAEFSWQCERLATLAGCAAVNRSEAAYVLQDIADANSLGETFGREYVDLIAEAFGPGCKAEAAA